MPDYLLGIDLGTSGSKALLMKEDGSLCGTATHSYETQMPRPSWAEQNPEVWETATVQSIRAVLGECGVEGEQVAAVGLTGQMHGLVALNEDGAVLRPAILWNDQRTGEQCAAITKQVGAERVLEWTGNPVLPGFTAPKIEWVREHEPEVFEQIAAVLLPKDYIRYRLTGTQATDVSDASGTSLFDVENRRWSEPMLDALHIPRAWLPQVTESRAVSAHIDRHGARATGLQRGTPVIAGAGDQAAGAVGTGATEEGIVSITLGTSGVVFAASDSYRVDPGGRLHAFCHAVPETWHLMGVMLSAAGSLQWFRRAVWEGDEPNDEAAFEPVLAAAREARPGSEGLLFLPYLSGERTPHADPDARGVYFGLHLRHEPRHLARAVLEGVAFGLRDSLALMRTLGISAQEVRVSGGGAQSPLWRQILADVLDRPVVHATTPHGAALGAALLAGVGIDRFADVSEATSVVYREAGRTAPTDSVATYDAMYDRYRALYPALRKQFAALSETTDRLF